MNKIFLGAHVSMSAPNFLLGSVKEALAYGANAFMIYTGAPQNSYRVPVEKLYVQEAHQLMIDSGIDRTKVIIHAPYIVNLANLINNEIFEISKRLIKMEIARTAMMGFSVLVLHPGTSGQATTEEGLARIAEGLNDILENDETEVKIALETMSGKGSECGTTIEQMAQIIVQVKKSERIGICLDTCHLHDYGYDLTNFEEIINKVSSLLGIQRILCLHINDSKNEIGMKKDRHENIGYGHIGFPTLLQIVNHPLLVDVPKILETPFIEGKSPYQKEIAMLHEGAFCPSWREMLFK